LTNKLYKITKNYNTPDIFCGTTFRRKTSIMTTAVAETSTNWSIKVVVYWIYGL